MQCLSLHLHRLSSVSSFACWRVEKQNGNVKRTRQNRRKYISFLPHFLAIILLSANSSMSEQWKINDQLIFCYLNCPLCVHARRSGMWFWKMCRWKLKKVIFSLFSLFFVVFVTTSSCATSPGPLDTLSSRKFSHEKCDQSLVECETVSLDDSKKFKIININQASANLDGHGNKFELKTQLIEIDKLLINNNQCHQNGQNGTTNKYEKPSRFGVWHQVSVGVCVMLFSCDLTDSIQQTSAIVWSWTRSSDNLIQICFDLTSLPIIDKMAIAWLIYWNISNLNYTCRQHF